MQSRMSERSSCPDVLVIDLRGSGEAKGELSPPGRIFAKALQDALSEKSTRSIPFPYPAAGDKWTMVGAVVKIAFIGKYHDSVTVGKRALKTVIIELNQNCPSTKIILVGYSQGAHVIGDVYPLKANVLYGAVLFGDPRFNPVNGAINKYSFDRLRHGRLGARSVLKGKKASHYLSYCHRKDPVCQNIGKKEALKVRFKWHKNYQSLGEPQAAAKYFARLITGASGWVDKWPTDRHDMPPALQTFIEDPDFCGAWVFCSLSWSSCSADYCAFAGFPDTIYVVETNRREVVGTVPGWDCTPDACDKQPDPKKKLNAMGIPPKEIVELLRL